MTNMLTVSKVVILQLLTLCFSPIYSLSSQSNNIRFKTSIFICPGFSNDSIDYKSPLGLLCSRGLQTILNCWTHHTNSTVDDDILQSEIKRAHCKRSQNSTEGLQNDAKR